MLVVNKNRNGNGVKQRMVDSSGHDNGFIDCPYCESPTHYFDCEVDHIHPFNLGGSNKRDNLWLVCKNCNSAKQDMKITVWCYKILMSPESMYLKLKQDNKWIPQDLLDLLRYDD